MARVEVVTVGRDKWGEWESIEVRVDGELVGGGSFGGEPEDNSRHRDYSWVDSTIRNLGQKLGAEVEFKEEIKEEDE